MGKANRVQIFHVESVNTKAEAASPVNAMAVFCDRKSALAPA
jgi:hypothetical protein